MKRLCFHLKRLTVLAAIGALVLPATVSAQQAMRPTTQDLKQATSGGNDWITYGGALNNQRYSSLSQINSDNVQNLQGAWMTRLGSGDGSKYKFEADPLVVDGIMYIPTGNDDIFALDAKTGRKMWEYNSDIPQVNDLICCGWDNRGVAAGEGMIYSGQLDGSFVALDQKTGKIAWRTQLEDYHDGYSITGATRYYDGLVFTGMAGGENGIRGRLYALDARTGNEVWRFYTIPAPGEFGSDSWPSGTDAWTHGGGTIWQGPAIDPDLGMLYFSTGNAGPDYDGSVRPGDNLFTASMVALDYRTGQYRWHFQQTHHDIWDYDSPSPVVLFDQMYNGQQRKGIYECSKTGWCYFLDRTSGQPLIGITEKPVDQEPRNATAATQPFPVGDSVTNQCPDPLPQFPVTGCVFAPFWDTPVLMRPGGGGRGGTEFSPTSYSPQTGFVYVNAGMQDGVLSVAPQRFVLGKRYTGQAGGTALGAPIKSTFTAMDSRTNKIAWQKIEEGDQGYGAVSTAGGLVFRGKLDGNLVAEDAQTGQDLWQFQTGWGISAPPMTYSLDGTQYVVVAAGGNRGGATTLDGDAVWAFSLTGTVGSVAAPKTPDTRVALAGAPKKIGDVLQNPGTIGDDQRFDGTIDTEDYSFSPVRVSVPVGTTLTWQNNGAVVHTATEQHGAWNTGDINGGQSASVTFDQAGTYLYSCVPHPWMIGEITVQ
jgi:quinohemoprotein ethanol dehydrogenase